MALLAVGVSHRSADAALRGMLAFDDAELPYALPRLLASSEDVREAVILSTCNRTEVYADATTVPLGVAALKRFLAEDRLGGAADELCEDALRVWQGRGMVRHLFRVVCSLDSLVLGENQILAQVRDAFGVARQAGAVGELLDELFRRALQLGKRVRSETAIGAGSVSVSTAAVGAACEELGTLEERALLVVGAGEMAGLTARYAIERGAASVTVCNRTLARAQELARQVGGRAVGYECLSQELAAADLVISQTAASGYVLSEPLVAEAMASRDGRPLVLVDIALPADIDPEVVQIPGVTLISLDDLGERIQAHRRDRERDAREAEGLVSQAEGDFLSWMQQREVTPTIKEIYGKAAAINSRELERACRELAKVQGAPVSERQRAVLEALARAVSNKLLHGPVVRLRKQADNPDAFLYTESARFLFGLDNNPLGLPCKHDVHRCRLDRGDGCSLAQAGTCPFGRRMG